MCFIVGGCEKPKIETRDCDKLGYKDKSCDGVKKIVYDTCVSKGEKFVKCTCNPNYYMLTERPSKAEAYKIDECETHDKKMRYRATCLAKYDFYTSGITKEDDSTKVQVCGSGKLLDGDSCVMKYGNNSEKEIYTGCICNRAVYKLEDKTYDFATLNQKCTDTSGTYCKTAICNADLQTKECSGNYKNEEGWPKSVTYTDTDGETKTARTCYKCREKTCTEYGYGYAGLEACNSGIANTQICYASKKTDVGGVQCYDRRDKTCADYNANYTDNSNCGDATNKCVAASGTGSLTCYKKQPKVCTEYSQYNNEQDCKNDINSKFYKCLNSNPESAGGLTTCYYAAEKTCKEMGYSVSKLCGKRSETNFAAGESCELVDASLTNGKTCYQLVKKATCATLFAAENENLYKYRIYDAVYKWYKTDTNRYGEYCSLYYGQYTDYFEQDMSESCQKYYNGTGTKEDGCKDPYGDGGYKRGEKKDESELWFDTYPYQNFAPDADKEKRVKVQYYLDVYPYSMCLFMHFDKEMYKPALDVDGTPLDLSYMEDKNCGKTTEWLNGKVDYKCLPEVRDGLTCYHLVHKNCADYNNEKFKCPHCVGKFEEVFYEIDEPYKSFSSEGSGYTDYRLGLAGYDFLSNGEEAAINGSVYPYGKEKSQYHSSMGIYCAYKTSGTPSEDKPSKETYSCFGVTYNNDNTVNATAAALCANHGYTAGQPTCSGTVTSENCPCEPMSGTYLKYTCSN